MKTPDFIKVVPNALSKQQCDLVLDDFNVLHTGVARTLDVMLALCQS